MKYIDSEKLIAEIKRRMEDYNASIEKYYNKQKSIKAERDSWKWAECKWFLNLITSLQQERPEVDLEEETKRWKNKYGVVGMDDLWLDFARHFYELGRARKEE